MNQSSVACIFHKLFVCAAHAKLVRHLEKSLAAVARELTALLARHAAQQTQVNRLAEISGVGV